MLTYGDIHTDLTGSDQSRLSVVVCAYTERRWSALVEALDAVLRQRPHQLVLVVDHNEVLLQRARDSFPRATVLANAAQRGLSGARNTGVANSDGDIVVFLDDDACPRPGWLQQLQNGFRDPEVMGVGGSALPRWESGRPAWIPSEFLWVVGCSYRGLPDDAQPIRNPIGANMAFRRAVFEQVGGFTDGIGRVGRTPLGCEETEFAIRAAQQLGGRIELLPAAQVDHLVPADRTSWAYFRHRCWAEGLSKAVVARLVGADSALQSERGYVMRTLPSGALQGVRDAVAGDPNGLVRLLAIIAGLAITSAGYLRGRMARSAGAAS